MESEETWTPISWHCANCGSIVTGYQNKKGVIKVECKKCRYVMVRTHKRKPPDTFLVFPPEEQTLEAQN